MARIKRVFFCSLLLLVGGTADAATILFSASIPPAPLEGGGVTVPILVQSFDSTRGVLDSVAVMIQLFAQFQAEVLSPPSSDPSGPVFTPLQYEVQTLPAYMLVGGYPVFNGLTLSAVSGLDIAPSNTLTTLVATSAPITASNSVPSPFFSSFETPYAGTEVLRLNELGTVYSALFPETILEGSGLLQGSVTVLYDYTPYLKSTAPQVPEPGAGRFVLLGVLVVGMVRLMGWAKPRGQAPSFRIVDECRLGRAGGVEIEPVPGFACCEREIFPHR